MSEIKICPSFNGYSASSCGKIFSHRKKGSRLTGKWGGSKVDIDHSFIRELKGYINKKNYRVVGSRHRTIGFHQLVADAFHGKCPDGMQVRHLDGNSLNNSSSNLAYGTILENNRDRIIHGTYTAGAKHHSAKLTDDQVFQIRTLRANRVKVKELAKLFSVSIATIESVIYNKSYKILSTTGKPETL